MAASAKCLTLSLSLKAESEAVMHYSGPQVRQWLCLRVNQDQEVGRDFKDLFCPSSPLIYVAPLGPSSLSHVVLWFRFQSGQGGLVFVDTSYD